MKVQDAAHGVRILKALVEQVEKLTKKATWGAWFYFEATAGHGRALSHISSRSRMVLKSGPDGMPTKPNCVLIAASRSLVPALVEGATAALEELRTAEEEEEITRGIQGTPAWELGRVEGCHTQAKRSVIAAAQAAAPRMEEAGMEVPDA